MKFLNTCTIFLFFVLIVLVYGKPEPGWLFGNDDKQGTFFQGQGVSRIKTVNNNNINYSDNSRHYNFNIQETNLAVPSGRNEGNDGGLVDRDVEVFAEIKS